MSHIESDMLMRGWNFNAEAGSFLNFLGGEVIQSRGKWNKLKNPVYVPASYDFLAGRLGAIMQCPTGTFMTSIMISPFIGKVAFLGISCAQPDTTAFQQYSIEGCLNIDLGYVNKCPDEYWFAGMDLTNGEQIICCQPVYTCRDPSTVFPIVNIK